MRWYPSLSRLSVSAQNQSGLMETSAPIAAASLGCGTVRNFFQIQPEILHT